LGVTIDKHFTFAPHAQCVVKSCNYHVQALSRICHLLSRDVANTIYRLYIIVGSRLDYCNSLLYGSTEAVVSSLQRVQSNLARTVLHSVSYNSSESNLRELHWLPIRERIRYKIANLCYRAVRVGQPLYLAELVCDCKPVRLLRSSDDHTLTVQRSTTVIASRTSHLISGIHSLFTFALHASSSDSSRSQLKTHLLSIVFDAHP